MPDQTYDKSPPPTYQGNDGVENTEDFDLNSSSSADLLPSLDEFEEYFNSQDNLPSISTTSNQTGDSATDTSIVPNSGSPDALPSLEIDFGSDITTGFRGPLNDGEQAEGNESEDPDQSPVETGERESDRSIDEGERSPEESDGKDAHPETYQPRNKETLESLASEHLGEGEQLEQFRNHIEAFEKRAETAGIPQADKEQFYGQVGAVLEASASPNEHYSAADLKDIAGGMMRHAADPGTVDQGAEATCSTAALETVLYTKEPATVGAVVADIAIKGEYRTNDDTAVTLSDRNFKLDKYKAEGTPESARDLSSHIAQLAMINAHWARQDGFLDGETGKRGHLRYEEGHPKDYIGDSRSRMMDYSKDSPTPYTQEVGVSDPRAPEGIFMTDTQPLNGPSMQMEYMGDLYSQLRGNKGSLTIVNGLEGKDLEVPASVDEFKQILSDAQNGENGRTMPILLGVFANREPFLSDLSSSTKELSEEQRESLSKMHAHHAVAITGYDPETGSVTVENQWGESVDHTGREGSKEKVDVADLFAAVTTDDGTKDKNESAPRPERKEPTEDDYIDSQQKFVDELAKDDAVDPRKLWSEQLKLHGYLTHFGRHEEAGALEKPLVEGLQKRLNTEGLSPELISDTSSLFGSRKGEGDEFDPDSLPTDGSELLSAIDKSLLQSIGKEGTDIRSIRQVLDLHERIGDKQGGENLGRAIMEQASSDFKPQDLLDREKRRDLIDVVDLFKQTGHDDLASEMAGTMLKGLEQGPDGDNPGNKPVTRESFEARASLQHLYRSMDPEVAKGLKEGLDSDYDRFIEDNGVVGENSDDAARMRNILIDIHEGDRNKDRVGELIGQQLEWLESLPAEAGGTDARGADHPSMIGPNEHLADTLRNVGDLEGAARLYERALELSETHGQKDRQEWFVPDLVGVYDKLGQPEKADALIERTGIEVFRFRRRN